MSGKNFDQIVLEQFHFLITDYGFKFVKKREENWGYDIVFLNATTGVHVIYEFREAYIFIMLYRLINGKLVENPSPITENSVLNAFCLDDIVTIKNPDATMKPAYYYGIESEFYNKEQGMTLYVSKFADNLKIYAADVLTGNFEIFTELDQIVKKRAKQAR
ncbi:hypothetical protein U27_05200 [Candidatus Vecturithrix granuli]|uniref:Uncharacterized protein n=1 Tax=Vecturithrix granuli TaxID=1499967 RepID=A0A081C0X2_VECG1|nr:hypothetical protein U27_05200 [Candidatus Vecturithrix granuli]